MCCCERISGGRRRCGLGVESHRDGVSGRQSDDQIGVQGRNLNWRPDP